METKYNLKVQSYKLYDNKYMIASIQINTEIFAFIAVLVFESFKLSSRKVLFINKKTIETVKEYAAFEENSTFHG